MKINECILPRDEIVLIATIPSHIDTKIWNIGKAGEHPLDQFWAERFLVYPGDPTSGPKTNKYHQVLDPSERGKPRFSLNGLGGIWIPYGGGFRACPGRRFAKREILMTLAVMVTMFDVEIDKTKPLRIDRRANGLGAQRPKTSIPFRIRRRKLQK